MRGQGKECKGKKIDGTRWYFHICSPYQAPKVNKYSFRRNFEEEQIVGVHVQLEKNLQLVATDLPFWKALQG